MECLVYVKQLEPVAGETVSCRHCCLLWWCCHHHYCDVTVRWVSEAPCLGETIQKSSQIWHSPAGHGSWAATPEGEQYQALTLSWYSSVSLGEASLRALKQGPTCTMKFPETNSLHWSVPVADIKAIVTGKDCPHMKEKSALKQNKVSGEAVPCLSCCHRDSWCRRW